MRGKKRKEPISVGKCKHCWFLRDLLYWTAPGFERPGGNFYHDVMFICSHRSISLLSLFHTHTNTHNKKHAKFDFLASIFNIKHSCYLYINHAQNTNIHTEIGAGTRPSHSQQIVKSPFFGCVGRLSSSLNRSCRWTQKIKAWPSNNKRYNLGGISGPLTDYYWARKTPKIQPRIVKRRCQTNRAKVLKSDST